MNNKILIFLCLVCFPFFGFTEELPNENELILCQDQADNFGNGKGDDHISEKCALGFKTMAAANSSIKESSLNKIKVYGHRNMILVDKVFNNKPVTEIIAGSSTELHKIKALAIDEKNQEIAVLEESGDVLFFSSKITGNVAPFRILRNQELIGASDLVVDSDRDMVIVNNKKSKTILFFSRLANINGRKEKQRLEVVKTIDSSLMDPDHFNLSDLLKK